MSLPHASISFNQFSSALQPHGQEPSVFNRTARNQVTLPALGVVTFDVVPGAMKGLCENRMLGALLDKGR